VKNKVILEQDDLPVLRGDSSAIVDDDFRIVFREGEEEKEGRKEGKKITCFENTEFSEAALLNCANSTIF
jgi:hypothetical protein